LRTPYSQSGMPASAAFSIELQNGLYTVKRCLSVLFKELPPHFGLNELLKSFTVYL
jgi:hypothetical protein